MSHCADVQDNGEANSSRQQKPQCVIKLLDLPEAVLLRVLKNLDMEALNNFSLASHGCKHLAFHDKLWKHVCLQHFYEWGLTRPFSLLYPYFKTQRSYQVAISARSPTEVPNSQGISALNNSMQPEAEDDPASTICRDFYWRTLYLVFFRYALTGDYFIRKQKKKIRKNKEKTG